MDAAAQRSAAREAIADRRQPKMQALRNHGGERGEGDCLQDAARPLINLAYDRRAADEESIARPLPIVAGVSVLLALFFIVESFGPFLFGARLVSSPQALAVLGLTVESPLQTVMLLQLVVGANLVLFASGTENGFLRRSWAQAPLFSLLFFAQLATTLMCALGLLVEPISWQVSGWVWGYNLVWLAILRGVWLTADGVAAFLAADGIDPGGAERPVVAITTAAAPGKRPRPYLISSERAPDQHR